MEFLKYKDVSELLSNQGITETTSEDDLHRLEVHSGEGEQDVVHLHLADPESEVDARGNAREVTVNKQRLAEVIKHVIEKLHLAQILLIPLSKWQNVFDAVAFSLAENEEWQAIDASATVRLNTRDPLLCEPGDLHLLSDLLKALFQDAESQQQGMTITTTATPMVIEAIPDTTVRISVGNAVVADEIVEAFSEE